MAGDGDLGGELCSSYHINYSSHDDHDDDHDDYDDRPNLASPSCCLLFCFRTGLLGA